MTTTTVREDGLVRTRSGCKVGWEYYSTREFAEARVERAREHAARQAAEGYDFGYSVPGEITECADGTFRLTIA